MLVPHNIVVALNNVTSIAKKWEFKQLVLLKLTNTINFYTCRTPCHFLVQILTCSPMVVFA